LRAVLAPTGLALCVACRFGGEADGDPAASTIPTARARKGEFRVTVEEVGVLRARSSTTVKPAFWGRIAKLVPEGTNVAAGEPIIWLETTDLEAQLGRADQDLESARNELSKQLERVDMQRKGTALQLAESEAKRRFNEAKLDTKRREEADAARQAAAGLVPATVWETRKRELREAELEDDRARLQHEQQLEDVRLRERQLDADRQQAERRFADSKTHRDEIARRLENAVMKAPAPGRVHYPETWVRGTSDMRPIRVADMVGPWGDAVELPDLSTLEVRSQVDESLTGRVAPGLPAEVRLTALGDVVLEARVASVDLLAVPRSKSEGAGYAADRKAASEQVVVPLTLRLERGDDRLQPGMTTTVSYVLEVLSDAVWIESDAIFGGDDRPIVFVRANGGHEEREVTLGPESGGRVVVRSGLSAGDEVYLGDPREERRDAAAGGRRS
jgi:multidrug resistance efflux pump